MNFRQILTVALLAAAITLPFAPAAKAADTPASLTLINLPSDSAGVAYYAADLGYFKDAGLDVHITSMTNQPAIVSAVVSGSGDIGNATVSAVANARAKGLPVLFIAPGGLYDAGSPVGVAVLKDSLIKRPADLVGKVVAVSSLSDLTYYSTRAAVDEDGGNSAEVKFIELPYPAMGPALEEHRIDAAYIIDPFFATLEGKIRVVARESNSVAPRFIATGFFATGSWLQTHKDIALRFRTAIRRAAIWANSHHKESAAILLRYVKIDPAVAVHMYRVPYALDLGRRYMQPVMDVSAKYIGKPVVSASSLIWTPAKPSP